MRSLYRKKLASLGHRGGGARALSNPHENTLEHQKLIAPHPHLVTPTKKIASNSAEALRDRPEIRGHQHPCSDQLYATTALDQRGYTKIPPRAPKAESIGRSQPATRPEESEKRFWGLAEFNSPPTRMYLKKCQNERQREKHRPLSAPNLEEPCLATKWHLESPW